MGPFIRRFQTAQGLSKLVIHDINMIKTIEELGRGLLRDGGELEAIWQGSKRKIIGSAFELPYAPPDSLFNLAA